jgi:putative membrane protein
MDQNTPSHGTAASPNSTLHTDAATELSARRTGMSFQRTRMSADRTLMSVIRTSLSLISFGFTIFQFFKNLTDDKVLANSHAARNFGTALVYLGVIMITVGIVFHAQFMRGLREQRREMTQEGLIHGESAFPPSFTLLTAVLLLLLGLLAIASVSYHAGPMS